MKKLLLIIALAGCLFACDDRLDFLIALNQPPTISVYKGGASFTNTFSDSVKTSVKNGNSPYLLNLVTSDPEKLVKTVYYTAIQGQVKVSQLGAEVTSITIDSEGRGEVYLEPVVDGTQIIRFTVVDNLGNEDNIDVTLISFNNIKPEAVLDLLKVAVNSPYEYDLIGERSYDRDAPQGGGIVRYEWDINGTKFFSDKAISRFIFPSSGTYEIKLRVIDNDGQYSTIASRILTLS